jgi:glycogen(starch) synthase
LNSFRGRVLMLVWTSVHTDTRVLREATSLVAAGYTVHIVGRAVPEHFVPAPGITVESAGHPPLSSGRGRTLTAPERLARWALLPVHVDRRLAAWQAEVRGLLARAEQFDVVHAHDFSALPVGAEAARRWGVPLVYDSHELWGGRPTEGRPAPLRSRRDRSGEAELGGQAAAVLTVGDGVATALHEAYGWSTIHVVRNTFPLREVPPLPAKVQGLVYAGRLAADRELEVVARASTMVDLPITILGPADEEWLRSFDPEAAQVLPAESLAEIDARLVGAGAALVTHSDRWPNHRLALPNKLFHAVSLGLPVVATDVGELGAIVRAYGLGALYRPGHPAALAAAVSDLEEDYAAHVATVSVARSALSWEHDEQVLRSVYDSLPRTVRR